MALGIDPGHGQTVNGPGAKSLGQALQRLLADPALARRLGDAARTHAAANFSYQRMLDRMEEIYRQVSR